MDRMLNAFKSIAASQAGALGQPRMAIVTSYDSVNHRAKVLIQPEEVLSGWLPVLSTSVGAGWGLHVPLKTGEQVLILPHDGDAENGVIVGRVFSDVMRPPDAGGADIHLQSSGGAKVTLMPGGTVEVKDAAGVSFKLTNDGNVHLNAPNTIFLQCQSFNVQASVNVTLQSPAVNISGELDVAVGPIKQNGITVVVP